MDTEDSKIRAMMDLISDIMSSATDGEVQNDDVSLEKPEIEEKDVDKFTPLVLNVVQALQKVPELAKSERSDELFAMLSEIDGIMQSTGLFGTEYESEVEESYPTDCMAPKQDASGTNDYSDPNASSYSAQHGFTG